MTADNAQTGAVVAAEAASASPTPISAETLAEVMKNDANGMKGPSGSVIAIAVIVAVAIPLISLLLVSAYRRRKRRQMNGMRRLPD